MWGTSSRVCLRSWLCWISSEISSHWPEVSGGSYPLLLPQILKEWWVAANGKALLILRWRMIILRVLYEVPAQYYRLPVKANARFWRLSSALDQILWSSYLLMPCEVPPSHSKRRVSLPQVLCLNCVVSLDSALNYNMGSGVTGNDGKFNFGRKDRLFRVPVGNRFCLCWRRSRIIDFQLLEMESRFITTNFLNFTWLLSCF